MKINLLLQLILFSAIVDSQDVVDNYDYSQSDKISEQTITIEPYLQLSNGAFFTSLTLVSDNPYVDYVKGFDFNWGIRYQLKVKERIFAMPPQDMSDREFELIEVLLQTPAKDNFEMILINEFYLSEPKGESITKLKAGRYRYHDEMEFNVPPKLRAEFDRKMKKKSYCRGYFGFDKNDNIILLKIE